MFSNIMFLLAQSFMIILSLAIDIMKQKDLNKENATVGAKINNRFGSEMDSIMNPTTQSLSSNRDFGKTESFLTLYLTHLVGTIYLYDDISNIYFLNISTHVIIDKSYIKIKEVEFFYPKMLLLGVLLTLVITKSMSSCFTFQPPGDICFYTMQIKNPILLVVKTLFSNKYYISIKYC